MVTEAATAPDRAHPRRVPYLVDANLTPARSSAGGTRSARIGPGPGAGQFAAVDDAAARLRDGALYSRPARRSLRPFDYFHAGRFATRWSLEDRVRLYAVAGGIPDYLEEFDDHRSLREELLRLAFSPDGRLFREAPDLLRSEFTEPRTYESIVRAVAQGANTPGLIADQAGLSGANRVNPYLDRLIDLGLVERRTLPGGEIAPRPREPVRLADLASTRRWFGAARSSSARGRRCSIS